MKDKLISRFPSIRSRSQKIMTVADMVKEMLNPTDKQKEDAVNLRLYKSNGNEDAYVELKTRAVTYIPTGYFMKTEKGYVKSKANYDVDSYNSIIPFDIDNLSPEQMDQAFEKLGNIPFVYFVIETPSGKGVRGLMYLSDDLKADHEKHEIACEHFIYPYLAEKTGLEMDYMQGDYVHKFYYTTGRYYLNEDAIPWMGNITLIGKKMKAVEEKKVEQKKRIKSFTPESAADNINNIPNNMFEHYDTAVMSACQASSNRQDYFDKYNKYYNGSGLSPYLTSLSTFNDYIDSKVFDYSANFVPDEAGFDDIEDIKVEVAQDLKLEFNIKLAELLAEESKLEALALDYKLIDKENLSPKLIQENKIRISKQRQLKNDIKKLKLDYNIEEKNREEASKNLREQINDDRRGMLIQSLQKYIQVGDNYFEMSYDKYNNKEYEPRKYENIKRKHRLKDFEPDDFIKCYYSKVTIVDNLNYKHDVTIGGDLRLNEYNEMPFKPIDGDWKHIKIMLDHLFGNKIEFILDYFKLLYLQPLQKLPIIALVSKAGDTGKSTFLHFVNEMFGNNSVQIGSTQLKSNFNHIYANKLIAMVDETYIDKKEVQEQIKSYVTQKEIVLTEKYASDRSVEFFTKFIMSSNNVDFTSASETETRYAVFNPTKPKFKIVDIERKMKEEIPAFLHYLLDRVFYYEEESRLYFDEKVYETDEIINLKKNSRTNVVKDLIVYFDEFLNEFELKEITFTINELVLQFKLQGNISYIRRKLREDFSVSADQSKKTYVPFSSFYRHDHPLKISKMNAYTITRKLIDDML